MAVSVAMQAMFDEVVMTLGGTLVDVELSESDLVICFNKAKRRFQSTGANNFRRKFVPLEVVKTSLSYSIPSNIDTIVRIVKPGVGFTMENAFAVAAYSELFDSMLSGGAGGGCGGFDNLTYELALSKIEQIKRTAAFEMQFNHDKFLNTISFMKAPEANAVWLMDCYEHLEDDEYATVEWIIRWTTAEAKHALGMAYRKFQSLAAPTGETSMAGEQYLQEAAQEKEQLMTDLENFIGADVDFGIITYG